MLPQEGEFRTVQAHAFGAAGLQFVHLFQALQVGMDTHAHAVAHLGGPVGLAAGAGLPLLILALALFIGGQVVGIGVQQQAAVEAVHADLFTGLAGLQQAGDAHQGRDVQAARQNGRVRRGPALCRDDGPHVLEIHVHDVGGRKILGGQDTGTGRGGQGAAAGQAFAQAQAHGPDILRTVAQIGVVHVAEDAAQLFHRAVQGPGGADQFLLDAGKGAAHQLGIAGQFDLGGDDFTVFGKVFRDLGHGFLQGGAHIGHGGAQLFLLAFHFARADAAHLHGLDIVGEAQHPDGDAGRDGRTEKKRACHISPADFPDNRPGPSGLRGGQRAACGDGEGEDIQHAFGIGGTVVALDLDVGGKILGLLRQTGSRPCVQPATRMQRDGEDEAFGCFLNFCHEIFSLVARGDLYDLFLTVPRTASGALRQGCHAVCVPVV